MELNINPHWWGHNLWQSINAFIAVYPDNPSNEEINSIQIFFKSLQNLIPCYSCRNTYNIYIKEDDTSIDNLNNFNKKDNLIFFVYKLRNKVNNKLNINYNITFNYFKSKLEKLTCKDNDVDVYVNNLIETPIIIDETEKNIIKYLKNNNFNYKKTIKIINVCKNFIDNPIFEINNNNFNIFYDRNKKCKKIINKIYFNISNGDYNLEKSFYKDKSLHEKLFFLGCNILPIDFINKII